MTQSLHIRMLGDFVLRAGAAMPPDTTSSRLQALLCYLVLHRDAPQSRRQVAFLLWPDSAEAAAFTNLRAVLHRLRRLMPQAELVVRVGRSELQWQPHVLCQVDVIEFETALQEADQAAAANMHGQEHVALARAIACYGGELLPGCYDDWLLTERDRLHRRYVQTLQRLVALLEAEHDIAAAIVYAERLVDVEPLDESAYRVLIRLHAATGNRGAALRVFETCAERLRRELGVEPDARMQEAYAHLFQDAPRPSRPTLPIRLTVLLGREREFDTGKHLLADASCRLLTLTGPGGVGKTRLAEELTAALHPSFTDGAVFVALGTVPTADLVHAAISNVVGAQTARLTSWLAAKHMLLVLDNFEHVLDAAVLVGNLLAAAPRLQVLVTSREPLGLHGEHQLELAPLELPDRWQERAPDVLLENAAIQLFAEHARAADAFFRLTPDTVRPVAEICVRLDGLPLALELAAAWSRLLPLHTLLAQLVRPLDLLIADPRDQPARHHTLRETIAWSFRLLEPAAQTLFMRLAIFAGPFTVEAVSHICMDSPASSHYRVLHELRALASRSLIRRSVSPLHGDDITFEMLATLRDYAHELLNGSGEQAQLRQRHARYYLELAEHARAELYGAEQWSWMDRLDAAHADLRVALGWLLRPARTREDSWLALRMAAALARFWGYRVYARDAHHWLEHVLTLQEELGAASEEEPTMIARWAEVTYWAALVAPIFDDETIARVRLETSAMLWGRIGERARLAEVLFQQASLEPAGSEAARRLHQECAYIWEQVDQPWATAMALSLRSSHAVEDGNPALARTLTEERLRIERSLNNVQGTAEALLTLALHALTAGISAETRTWLQESLRLWRGTRFTLGILPTLEALAWAESAHQRFAHAARLLGAAAALRAMLVTELRSPPAPRFDLEPLIARIREALGEDAYLVAWNSGARQPLEWTIDHAAQDELLH